MAKFRHRLRGLGDGETYINAQGCVVDSDGNLLTCPKDGQQTPGIDPYTAIGVSQISSSPGTPTPSSWSNFKTWLAQPVAAGLPSNGTVIGFSALGTALISLFKKGKR